MDATSVDATATCLPERALALVGPIENEISLKIVILGGARVGKSACVRRFVAPQRSSHLPYCPTIGVDITSVQLPYAQAMQVDRHVRLQFWDVAAAELRGWNLAHLLGRADAAVLVFDLHNPVSFSDVYAWLDQLRLLQSDRDVPCILLATHSDRVSASVTDKLTADLDHVVRRQGLLAWRAVTVVQGPSVHDAVSELVHEALCQRSAAQARAECTRPRDSQEIQSKLRPPGPSEWVLPARADSRAAASFVDDAVQRRLAEMPDVVLTADERAALLAQLEVDTEALRGCGSRHPHDAHVAHAHAAAWWRSLLLF
eukprot:gnl/Spiro4/29469_TR14435_c3_g1_i2.p2 gnl/Spiro4/29469_TR14435_c3_g1~~gnl/Spiro4/29469_TR14435_c3_g1_i2.p2  ORF type:complete len:314 (-),score=90.27 gnl/Spiro4/29469_TR14435_c3_g1_i2:701-1642(-)